MSDPCKSRTEYFHEGGISDEDLASRLNKLEKEGWNDIEWEKEQVEKEVHVPTTYVIDAQRSHCLCKPRKKTP